MTLKFKLSFTNKKSLLIFLSTFLLVIGIALMMVGVTKSIDDWQYNNYLSKQAALLQYQSNHNINHIVPSTVKPAGSAITQYVVAPTLPKLLLIPKLGVDARILSVGLNYFGALETPTNVFDTAWYNQSAMPGQSGAMLIDGHISSWTAHGVFYGLNSLLPGDILEVVGGNGELFKYSVIKIQIYPADNVDMAAAMNSINPSLPGLNLISCSGDVIAGTNDFNERIIVFSTLIN